MGFLIYRKIMKKSKTLKRKIVKIVIDPTPEYVVKYTPLVKSIANYFYALNANVELEDLIQEGYIGLLMAIRRYDNTKNVSLGAFANRYVFGRIYRSLLGTKNLIHNKKMLLMELSDKIIDSKDSKVFLIDLYDFIETRYADFEAEALKMFLQNYSKSEIFKKTKMSSDEFNNLLDDFKKNFE
jgi:RNA polymerase sigma factor (sigma-70 family)